MPRRRRTPRFTKARGPGGLVLVEVGAPPLEYARSRLPSEDMLLRHDALGLGEQTNGRGRAAALPTVSVGLALLAAAASLTGRPPQSYRARTARSQKVAGPSRLGHSRGDRSFPSASWRRGRRARALVARDARNGNRRRATRRPGAWSPARGELALGAHDASPRAHDGDLGHLVLEPAPDLHVLEGRLAPASRVHAIAAMRRHSPPNAIAATRWRSPPTRHRRDSPAFAALEATAIAAPQRPRNPLRARLGLHNVVLNPTMSSSFMTQFLPSWRYLPYT